MIVFPNAKINIGLNVTEKRPDGYHNIETVFYPIGLTDILEIIESTNPEQKGIHLRCTGIPIDDNDNNLCIQAYELLRKHYTLPPVHTHLHKLIPIGAGLGGGSSDGGFMLSVLNEKFRLNISNDDLKVLAGQLGSDCPFFIDNTPSIAHGKGDILEEISLDLSLYTMILVYPGIHVSTAQAYSGIIPGNPGEVLSELVKLRPEEWKDRVKNDFENSIFQLYPEIGKIKDYLYQVGALYASMSGSGSAIYGIFEKAIDISSLEYDHVWIV